MPKNILQTPGEYKPFQPSLSTNHNNISLGPNEISMPSSSAKGSERLFEKEHEGKVDTRNIGARWFSTIQNPF